MYAITKSQFDQMVRDHYTPIQGDTLSQVRKYTYEAERSAMKDFIEDVKIYAGYDIDNTITEPLYVGITGDVDIAHDELFDILVNMNVYAMVIVNPGRNVLHEFENAGQWSFTQFHLYDDDPNSSYNSRQDRPPFRSTNLERVGFYGRGIYEWSTSYMDDPKIDVVTLDTLGMRIARPIELDVIYPVRIIDVDTRIDIFNIYYMEDDVLDRIEYMTVSSPDMPFDGTTAVNAHTVMGKMKVPDEPFQLGGAADDIYPNILQIYVDFVGRLKPIICLAPLTKYPNVEKSMGRYTKY